MKIDKKTITCLMLLLALSPTVYAKQIELSPADGTNLHDIMAEIKTYRTCMDQAQQTAKKGKDAYHQAQSQQCHYAFENLARLIDKQSLKSIDKLSWQRWHKRDAGSGFTADRILKTPMALTSGVEK